MTVESLITQHIDTWTSAVKTKSTSGRGSSKKLELYGVKKLRELILELAVRGKLVPQDPSDEPASVLLERIAAERFSEVKNGKLKKIKQISDFEYPCELPINWSFVRLEEIIQISSGKNLTAKKMDSSGNIPVYGGNGITGFHSEGNVSNKTIVIGRVGFYCGSIHLTPSNAWVTDNAFITKYSHANMDEGFLVWLLKATNLSENDSATAQPVISGKKVYPIVVALPPKKEQQFIAAKIDELMALCDQLEKQTEASIEAHQLLVSTLLNTLTHSADANELMDNWARISEHFDTLFTTEESIDQLKQTILQLAVMGKLVPQDPNDEPASVLLECIAEEKALLIKEKKIKKQKALPPIADDEKPFDLPNGWEWCRFGQVFVDLKYGTSKKSDYKIDGVPVLRIPNIVGGRIDLKDLKYSAMSDKELSDLELKKGDLLLIRSNGSLGIVGRSTVVDTDLENTVYAGYLVRARMITNSMNSNYLKSALDSLDVRRQIEGPIRSTSGVKNVNSTEISNLLIPLAPKNEQLRINEKVEDLYLMCDQLKDKLKESQTTQLHLTDAIVEQAV
ncbi:hypothetical protein A9D46_10555 [Photobacterium damselae subsp. damselae]|uniref:restriction endonuclease subunit S n=1 Tax=Photobacterium damselae TaxID=38293 RepID=UPI00084A57EB|nr:restriction endonuclease subunit S [Photobacterium damselae]OEC83536.1 hypothetical protein A9D46_10555 [Photobacterium damselae subsp. damselae]